MNDRIKIGFYYDTTKEMKKVLSAPIFEIMKTDTSKLTGEPVTICKAKNLQATFYHDSKYVRVSGSLIQFRHFSTPNKEYISPELYANNTYSDICFVTDYLSSLFAMNKREMKVTGLEFSLTAKVPETPTFYMEGLNSIQQKPFYYLPPPRNHSKPLEKYCPFSQYTAKCYNWGAWNKVKGNILRWEISFRKMQKVKQVTGWKNISLSDLTNKHFLTPLANFTMKTLRNTDKQLLIDYTQLKPRQREFLFAGANPAFWKTEKQINPNTAKKKRADYLNLYKRMEVSGHNPYNDLQDLLQSKYEHLMAN